MLLQLSNGLLDLAVLVTSLDKRAQEDGDAPSCDSPSHAAGPPNASNARRSVSLGDGSDRMAANAARSGTLQVIDAAVSDSVHLMSLFHAVALSSLRSAEDLTSLIVRFVFSLHCTHGLQLLVDSVAGGVHSASCWTVCLWVLQQKTPPLPEIYMWQSAIAFCIIIRSCRSTNYSWTSRMMSQAMRPGQQLTQQDRAHKHHCPAWQKSVWLSHRRRRPW